MTPNIQATSQSSEHLETLQHDEANDAVVQSKALEKESATDVPAKNVDPLDKFLPPPPKEKCPEELRVSFFYIHQLEALMNVFYLSLLLCAA